MNYNLRLYDDRGWAHIHHAAYRGYVKSLDKFIQADRAQADYETGDSLRLTPLLVAVLGGRRDAVDCLVRLGAKVNALDARGHGVIELAALGRNVELLSYFLAMNSTDGDDDDDDLRVWTRMLRMLSDDPEDGEIEAVTGCIRNLLDPEGRFFAAAHRKSIVGEDFLPVLVRALRVTSSDDARETILDIICRLLSVEGESGTSDELSETVREQVVGCGSMDLLIRFLKSSAATEVIRLSARILRDLCAAVGRAREAREGGAIAGLAACLRLDAVTEAETLVEVSEALRTIVAHDPEYQTDFGSDPSAIASLVALYSRAKDRSLLLTLTSTVVQLARGHRDNQLRLVDAGLPTGLVSLLGARSKDLQAASVDAIHALADGNAAAQRRLKDSGVVGPLLGTLVRLRQPGVQQTVARALWSIASGGGENSVRELREMSERIGWKQLVDFLGSVSEDLQLIGSEAIGILVQSSSSSSSSGAVPSLVRLLGSPREPIVLSAMRTLRYLSVRLGYVVRPGNQTMIGRTRGLKLLVAIMANAENRLLRAEAAFTIACASLGHQENTDEIQRNPDFSYRSVIRMFNSHPTPSSPLASVNPSSSPPPTEPPSDEEVRLLAGSALAAFAYNSVAGQKAIGAALGGEGGSGDGLSFGRFLPFLRSENDRRRCSAAFQVVVLSPLINDAEPAMTSAAGIRLLVDLLQTSADDAVLSEACDCIARLARTRGGIAGAIVCIDAIEYLCNLLLSSVEHVRTNAATAIGYLSFNHKARRQILARCRKTPTVMKALMSTSANVKISEELLAQWKHFEEIILPPIDNASNRLVASNGPKQQRKRRGEQGTTTRQIALSKSI